VSIVSPKRTLQFFIKILVVII